jgi:hypothetical protein
MLELYWYPIHVDPFLIDLDFLFNDISSDVINPFGIICSYPGDLLRLYASDPGNEPD